MIAFWICAAVLLVLALVLVLPALLKSKKSFDKTAGSAAQANLSVLRSQLTQLDADFAAGSINADQLALAKSEIERRALEEESTPEAVVAPAKSTRTAWAMGLSIPLVALGIYGFIGNIQALDPANLQAKAQTEPTPAEIEAMVSAFAARLEAVPASQPADPKAWEMLARSYAAMQKFSEASKAYKRAVELNPGNAQILADHADVLAMLQGQSMVGEPTRLFERALVLDPNNLKALALAGSAAFEKKDFAKAVALWEKASKLAPPGSDFAKGLASSVDEARAAAGQSGAPQVIAKSAPTPAVATANIQGVISLSPSLKSKVAPEDTVFIFARAAQGPRMPLAILKRKASDLPIAFTLDDSTAMADELKLSKFELVVVGARVSKSGNAIPQSGDLVGQSSPVKSGGSKLTLVIDAVQP
ncbi:MAG: c-type cytochrome biogenesis protein CcmI [Polaromonas sp.]|nr:c-type cytochrome biogenesis protein CcmI [Polaromonas sp.]